MILAFNLADIVQVPFGWLISALYQLTSNYGLALILFTILVKIILFPATAKSKKSSMKMSRMTPRVQELKKKFENDPQKQNEAISKLYKEEGVSMGGGCLWSLLPMLIIFPLYAVIRQPITYMLGETAEAAGQIVNIIKEALPDLFGKNSYYEQLIAVPHIHEFAQQIREAIPGIRQSTLEGVDFTFLNIDLGLIPQWQVWQWTSFSWSNIGAFLIPVLSAASQMLSITISQKMNNSLVTDEKGVVDKETAQSSQASQTGKMMLWMMPVMSLFIGFGVPAALSLYWLVQGLVSIVADMYLTKKYRTIYDAEDAERLKKHMAEEALEAEKERIRAERRAANPEGITDNTSKKKLQQQLQKQQEQTKAAAAREYAAKKGLQVDEPAQEEKTTLSGIPARPYCKGRAYDPNRYASDTTEE